MKHLILILLILVGIAQISAAQHIKKEDYFEIDGFAQKSGAMEGYSLAYIVDSITQNCTTELQMTRAFYCWISSFVAFDFSRLKHPKNKLDNASTALMERKAASEGFASLFKAMCDYKKIDCEVVSGIIRNSPKDIGHFNESKNHFWNSLSINNTSYLIDVSLAGGGIEHRKDRRIKDYSDAWWLCNRILFVYTHFPDEKNFQLLEIPFTKQEVSKGPIISEGAIVAGLIPDKTFLGTMKARAEDTTKLKFNLSGYPNVAAAYVIYDEKYKYSIPLDIDQFGFYLFVPNGPDGKHFAALYVNNKLAFRYYTRMRKAVRKKSH